MNRKKWFLTIVVTLCTVLGLADRGMAASTVAITPAGNSSFIVQGSGVENAAAMDIIINYDTTTLSSPQVAQGAMISGAMMAVNDSVPGSLRLGIIRTTPIKGTGVIATVTFVQKGDAAGNIIALKVSLSNIDGKPLPVLARVSNPATAAPDNGSSGTSQDAQPATAAGSPAPAGGGLPAVPLIGPALSETSASAGSKEQTSALSAGTDPASELMGTSRSATLSADAAGMTASAETSGKKIQRIKSVLDRFRDYKGERTRKAFARLFEQDDMTGFRQYPPVALSDGKSAVRVSFICNASSKTAADVAVMGARFVSIKKDPDYSSTWIVTLVPEKDSYEVSLAVSQGDRKMVYPLTVAPQAGSVKNTPVVATDREFDVYLKGKGQEGTAAKQKRYLTDYIVTANYLVAQQKIQASAK